MDAGFEVTNNLSFVQINSLYKNLELRQKVVVPMSLESNFGSWSGSVTVTGVMPVILFSSPYDSCMRSSQVSGNQFTYTFWAYTGNVSVRPTLVFYHFDWPDSGSLSSFGMQVFDGNGVLVYDALKSYMRVYEAIVFADYYSVLGSRTYDSKRTYAVMQSQFCGSYEQTADFIEGVGTYRDYVVNQLTISVNGNVVKLTDSEVVTRRDGPFGGVSSFNYNLRSGRIVVMDVTDF
ncbi:hypothetical protein [Pseudomonas protegens]|uniref:hypothetical protein n=1 Tax=Pseudomonas protegens TaxID=380021 RepID=UPI0011B1E4E5|nr:hypothetical protein [Pseudomonas protegens]